jgi:glycosyltransferase involved in cell wall biosynthesis
VKRQVWKQQHRIASGILLSTPAALQKVGNPDAFSAKIHVMSYGIDCETFKPVSYPEKKVILFLAHVAHHKGIFPLLEAFRLVKAQIAECELLIAGTGHEFQLAKRVAEGIDGGRQISFLGHVDRAHLPELINGSSVFCLPSYGEPFGLSALEAMACGRPVVATNANGLAHLVPDKGGRKVPPGDAFALAKALTEILSDSELARQMGTYNRRFVEDRCAWSRVIDQLERIYCDILASWPQNDTPVPDHLAEPRAEYTN